MSKSALTLAVAAAIALAPGGALAEQPWSVDADHPVLLDPAAPALHRGPSRVEDRDRTSNPASLVVQSIIWGYQHVVSPVDGATCGFYPTCSAYGMQAVQRHGWLIGWVMALERIMRNHQAQGIYPLVKVHGVYRLYDPVGANDFWFNGAARPSEPRSEQSSGAAATGAAGPASAAEEPRAGASSGHQGGGRSGSGSR